MKTEQLKTLVDLAIALDREIADRKERLKTTKKTLVAEAKKHKTKHVKTDGGGTSWTHDGNNGNIVRVTFPGKTLKDSLDGKSKTFAAIRKAAGNALATLFKYEPKYKLAPDFRTLLKNINPTLGCDASKLIKLCESKANPRVAFETKDNPEV